MIHSLGLLIARIQGEVIVENDCALINVNAFGHDIGSDEAPIVAQVTHYAGSLHPVHSSIGAGKGWPLITTFDSDTNTISIALITLYNNVQSSTRSCS